MVGETERPLQGVIRVIDSSLRVTVPFAVFPTQHFPTVQNDD